MDWFIFSLFIAFQIDLSCSEGTTYLSAVMELRWRFCALSLSHSYLAHRDVSCSNPSILGLFVLEFKQIALDGREIRRIADICTRYSRGARVARCVSAVVVVSAQVSHVIVISVPCLEVNALFGAPHLRPVPEREWLSLYFLGIGWLCVVWWWGFYHSCHVTRWWNSWAPYFGIILIARS